MGQSLRRRSLENCSSVSSTVISPKDRRIIISKIFQAQ
jgi:hypothetical protein